MLQVPEVQDRLRQARGEALAAAARTAAGLATDAVGVLAELMRNAASEGVLRLARFEERLEDDDDQAVEEYVARRERMGAELVVPVRSLAHRPAGGGL